MNIKNYYKPSLWGIRMLLAITGCKKMKLHPVSQLVKQSNHLRYTEKKMQLQYNAREILS